MRYLSKAGHRLGFNIHAVVFVMSIIGMAIINLSIGPPWWIQWPLLGWGIGLLAHGWFVLGPGAGWKE